MAKIRFRDIQFTPERAKLISQIGTVLAGYEGRVTVRQCFYQLVAANIIGNTPTNYGRVQDAIADARYAGLIDWDAIEDRTREPVKSPEFESARDALDQRIEEFRLDRWETQENYVELWVEKDALSGVLWPIAVDYHVVLMVNRGGSSASAMKESAERIMWRVKSGKRPVILQVGDFDPSGLNMDRDMSRRLREFGCPSSLDFRRIALTRAQIDEFKPPPNPLKRKIGDKYKNADGSLADPNAERYIAETGETTSWEVDALPPKTLELVTRQAISSYIDKAAMTVVITRENLIKKAIADFSRSFAEPK